MRGIRLRAWALLLGVVMALPAAGVADLTPLAKPIPARISVRQKGKPAQPVVGMVTAWDDDSFILKSAADERTLKWTDLTGEMAYRLRFQLIDQKDPQAWLALGTLAWGMNDTADARSALAQAARLDPKLKDDVDAVLASGADVFDPPELLHDIPPDQLPADDGPANGPRPKYEKVTPGQAKAAIAAARDDVKRVSAEMGIHFSEIETQHFLIFNNWNAGGQDFLKTNLEAAYTVVSREFDIPPSENIFVGKLPVYMFDSHDDFLRFGQTFDNLPKNRKDIAGYYTRRGRVLAHLAMSKPDNKNGMLSPEDAQTEWAYVLMHEFTHAFVARYRSSRNIPTWLNEGVAEVIASSQFPINVRPRAIQYAEKGISLAPLFQDSAGIQKGEMYPVMRTLTEVLLARGHDQFLKMFDDLKAGATGAQALKAAYGWTFDDLERYWRRYLGVKS